jgi:hypothetical protein
MQAMQINLPHAPSLTRIHNALDSDCCLFMRSLCLSAHRACLADQLSVRRMVPITCSADSTACNKILIFANSSGQSGHWQVCCIEPTGFVHVANKKSNKQIMEVSGVFAAVHETERQSTNLLCLHSRHMSMFAHGHAFKKPVRHCIDWIDAAIETSRQSARQG